MQHSLTIDVTDHEVQIQSNLRKMDPCVQGAVLNAMAVHLGYEPSPLHKAVTDALDADPRYPWLTTLIRAARLDWNRHGADLVHRLEDLMTRGQLLPMTAANEATLQELFRAHRVGVVLRFAGASADHRMVQMLVERGAIHPDYADTALVSMSYRMGRGLDALAVHHERGEVDLSEVVRAAAEVELTPNDQEAIRYARRRAAIYMRRPAEMQITEAERVLTEAERWAVGEVLATGIEGHKTTSQIKTELQGAVYGAANDMDRVARTELHFAHAHGAYVGLKDQTGRAGIKDPQVYKMVRPGACEHCQRIWGPSAKPVIYLLSYVEARDAAGGNFRTPASTWGPVIGPVHPNCTEGALLYYDPDLFDATQEALGWLRDTFGP